MLEPGSFSTSSGGNGLAGFFRDVARWYEAHKDEIQTFVV